RGLCHALKAGGLDKLISFDCHFLNKTGIQEFEGLTFENYSCGEELVEKALEIFNGEEFEIIGPDEGSRYLVEGYGGKSLKKVRKEYVGSKLTYRDVHEVDGEFNVSGKNVLILDDMISSGSTMVKCLEKVAAAGAKNIACGTTHGLFLFDCADRMRVFTRNIFATDTILSPLAKVSIKNKIEKLNI
ncbi:MAG: phosphoribosyltransferase family protein, partial [Patescibacteria group bacterium]